jgi:septal ring factor EnvC (AmiA/AmiB activator)
VERTRNLYRFELKLPAGKSGERRVTEERDLVETVTLSNADDSSIRLFLKSGVVSDAVKSVLQKALELREKADVAQQQVVGVEQRLREISEDQTRLRANLKEMPPTAAAYKRYLDKFDAQETQIDKLQGELNQLRGNAQQRRKELDNYLGSLEIG